MDTAQSIIAWLICNLADLASLAVELIIIAAIVKSCKYLAAIAKDLHDLYLIIKRQDWEYRQQADNQG